MKYTMMIIVLNCIMIANKKVIYSFLTSSNIKEWRIVNDGVMGGVSKSMLTKTPEGYGLFSGKVSLDNNGGFASIQLNTNVNVTHEHKFIILKVKGDRKKYEFRLKGSLSQRESYVHIFETSGDWQEVKLPLKEFYPQFRGQKLTIPNFNFLNIEQLSFLIANKKEESFELLIDSISLE
jgi:NADH dehydrogenase [ubiquinone] 1 alpha subcomplex assembly factor 1